jgi:hypothetical protein
MRQSTLRLDESKYEFERVLEGDKFLKFFGGRREGNQEQQCL